MYGVTEAQQLMLASRRAGEQAIDKETLKVFNDTDNPAMYEKLGIVRPKDLRNLSKYERDKIYEYCVERDAKLMKEKTGGVQKRNDMYINMKRELDPLFQELEKPAFNIPLGNFVRTNNQASEASWRATTVPYGFTRMARQVPSYVGIPEEEVGPTESSHDHTVSWK